MPSPSLAERAPGAARAASAGDGPPSSVWRTPVPTRRLLRAGVGLLVLGALVPLLPALAVLWWAVLALLALLVALDVLLRPPADAVSLTRETPAHALIGRASGCRLQLHNRTEGALAVSLREVLPPELEGAGLSQERVLAPGERVSLEVPFVPLERGEHALPPAGLGVAHPWGLLEYRGRVDPGGRVAVRPGRPAGEMEWLVSRASALQELGAKKVRLRGADREFESMREYVVGDEVRTIDWKASARRFRPMVKQFESERNAEVILGLDCGRLMGSLIGGVAKLDLALTPVLDLAAVALRRGERVGFLAFDSRPRAFLPPRGGLAHLDALRDAAARLPAPAQPTSYLRAVQHLEAHHRKRCLVLLFTDFTDELSAQEMMSSLAALTRRHVLIFVAVGDPHLEAVFAAPDPAPRALFQRAVAGQLLLERRRTLSRLERLGVFTLDAEPARLSGPLIRKYLEVRLRGVL